MLINVWKHATLSAKYANKRLKSFGTSHCLKQVEQGCIEQPVNNGRIAKLFGNNIIFSLETRHA